jgi:hypothetical protein
MGSYICNPHRPLPKPFSQETQQNPENYVPFRIVKLEVMLHQMSP